MKSSSLIALALAAGLAGCGPSEPASAPVAAAPAAPPPVGPEGPFRITNAGVGSVTAATRFNLRDLEKAFPGSMASAGFVDGTDVVPAIAVTGANDLKLDVLPPTVDGDKVGVVAVYGGPVIGPGGEKIGDVLADRGECKPGRGSYARFQLCRRPDAPQVAYVVSGGKIREFRWSVPGAPDPGEPKPKVLKEYPQG